MSEFINSIGEVLTNAFNNLRSSKDLLDNDTEDDDAVNSNNSAVNNVDQSILGLYRQTIIEIARHICKSLPEVSQKGELKAPVPSSVDNEYKVLFKQLRWQQPKSPYLPQLSKPRLRYLLTQINVSGRSSLSVEDGIKVIEDRWADITTYYKDLPNVDAVV